MIIHNICKGNEIISSAIWNVFVYGPRSFFGAT